MYTLGLFLLAKLHTLPLESLKRPLQCLSVLSASKNNYHFNEYKCCFASKLSGLVRFNCNIVE